MPTSAERHAVDTSVAVAAVDAGHAAHEVCRRAVVERRPLLAGHAAFETYSVLTRMPGPLAVDGPSVSAVLARAFPDMCWLDEAAATELRERCGSIGIVGGAIYDALVGESARVNGCRLLTRDLRARRTYDLLGVEYELIGLPG